MGPIGSVAMVHLWHIASFRGGAIIRSLGSEADMPRGPDERSDIRSLRHFLDSRISLRSCGLLAAN
jgi:hypothetical protein